MELQHFVAKIPIDGPLAIDPAAVVDIFHRWVSSQAVPGVLLIDVAELLHVPDGPGVIAVGYEADTAFDHSQGIWGVLSRRKTVLPGTNADRIAQALRGAALAGTWLEEAFAGKLKFSRTEFELVVNDRALAPNTPETAAVAVPAIESALRSLLGDGGLRVTRGDPGPRLRFGVAVRCARPFDLKALSGSPV
jgi:hypothetical protein